MVPDLSRITLLLAQGGAGARARILETLRQHEGASFEDLRSAQLRHLVQWFPAIAWGIPAYRERLASVLRKGAALTWEDVLELPLLTRSELQERGEEFECREPPPAFRVVSRTSTSGSTGRPLMTPGSRASGDWASVLRLRFLSWQGFDPDATCAFITGPTPPGQADPPEGAVAGRWAEPLGRGLGLTLDLKADTHDQLTWIERKRPAYLVTYPSNLLALLKASEGRGERFSFLRAVALSSEPVSQELVELCRRSWGALCLATYSANEVGFLATQVPDEDGYLVQSENAIVEVLRDDGSPCEPGEVGRVVVTTLHDLLRPLVRYEVGDYAEVGPIPEQTGDRPRRGFPRLRRIVGRERTMIRLPDGRRIWPFFEFAPLIEMGALAQWQLVQRRDGSLLVRLVAKRTLSEDEEARIRGVVEEALPGLRPELSYVPSIERTARGKYLEVVSERDADVE